MESFQQSLSSKPSEDDLVVTYAKQAGATNMLRRHQHPRHEIYYLVAGQRDYFIRDRVFRVRPGDVVVIPAQELHKTHAVGNAGYERLLIEFSDGFLGGLLNAVGRTDLLELFHRGHPVFTVPESQRPALTHVFARLLDETNDFRPGGEAMQRALLLELLVHLNRWEILPTELPAPPSPLHQTVSEVGLFLGLHYAQSMSLQSTARHFGLSPSYLSRVFVQVTGVNFGDYLATVRIRRARELLVSSQHSMEEIGRMTGFASQTSFGRVFLRLTGVSPRRYRLMKKK